MQLEVTSLFLRFMMMFLSISSAKTLSPIDTAVRETIGNSKSLFCHCVQQVASVAFSNDNGWSLTPTQVSPN